MKIIIGTFALISALCELFGSLTVWKSFREDERAAESIKKKLVPSAGEQWKNSPDWQYEKYQVILSALTNRLNPELSNRAGVNACIIGAGFGLVAAILVFWS